LSAPNTPRRNDPCPCGSGKRYKHCHGSLATDPRIARAAQLRAAGDLEAALAALREFLAAIPDFAPAHDFDGLMRHESMDLDGAIRGFQRAIAIDPDYADPHFNLALVLLSQGDYANGWREYDWRWRRPGAGDYGNFSFGMPRWRGEPLAGKRILVHAEQGEGDTIQFARFLTPLANQAAGVDVFCQPSLVSILARIPGVGAVLDTLETRPDHDYHAPIIDLAAHFVPRLDAPHWTAPYVAASPGRTRSWARDLEAAPGLRVGVAWKGSPKHVNDRHRSLTPELGARLGAEIAGITWVNLQAGEPPPRGAAWLDAGTRIRDWEDTAAIVDALDLVVSVDTAVAHLAGAMGKPVWTLIPYMPDWRWGISGSQTRWYPTMTLLRQPRRGDWASVLEEARARLISLPSSARGAASPP
jgi:hypothetical protein